VLYALSFRERQHIWKSARIVVASLLRKSNGAQE
jgi:hypothetical protein